MPEVKGNQKVNEAIGNNSPKQERKRSIFKNVTLARK